MKNLKKSFSELKKASRSEDEDKVNEILEELEDEFHVDLTEFYGEDFDDGKIRDLENRIGKKEKYNRDKHCGFGEPNFNE